jgi:hypothetical protein
VALHHGPDQLRKWLDGVPTQEVVDVDRPHIADGIAPGTISSGAEPSLPPDAAASAARLPPFAGARSPRHGEEHFVQPGCLASSVKGLGRVDRVPGGNLPVHGRSSSMKATSR